MIAIKPTPTRPVREPFEKLLVNPEIIETFGRKIGAWESCLNCGGGDATLFGRVPRYKKVRVKYLDKNGVTREIALRGLPAHVIQHEIDRLNGVLFLDEVARKILMIAPEYKKRVGTGRANWCEREK